MSIVSRTFSKAFGLAGLRVGYGLAQQELTDLMNRVRQPFNVNTVAQAAAVAALADDAFLARSYELNLRGMQQLTEAFEALGLEYVPSVGNFVLVKVGPAARVYQELLKRGVIGASGGQLTAFRSGCASPSGCRRRTTCSCGRCRKRSLRRANEARSDRRRTDRRIVRRGLRAAGAVSQVAGFDANADAIRTALSRGIIDRAATSAADAASAADLVVVATPVGAMRATFSEIAGALKTSAVVSDVGSTKCSVIDDAGRLSDLHFPVSCRRIRSPAGSDQGWSTRLPTVPQPPGDHYTDPGD